MYNVSSQYQTKINEAIRSTKLRGQLVIGALTIPLSEEDIAPGSVQYSNQCVDRDDFSIGSVFAGTLKLSLVDSVTALDLKGAKLSLESGLVTSVGVVEYVPIGVFTIIDAVHRLTAIVITAMDNMILLDVDLLDSLVGTPDQLLSEITAATGVLIENTSVAAFPNGTDSITATPCESLKTYRDLLMWLSEYLAAFATMSRTGKIWIRRVHDTPVGQIPAIVRFKSPMIKDESVKITGLAAKFSSTMYPFNLAFTPNDGKTFSLGDNPLFWSLDDTQAGVRLEAILNELGTVDYVPSEVEYNGNPALDVGDSVWLMGTVRGDVLTRITSLTWRSKSKSKLKSVGLSSILKVTNDLSFRQNKTRTEALVDKANQVIDLVVETVSELNDTVNGTDGLSARVNAAELKITPQAITQTVEDTSLTLAKKTYVDQTASGLAISAAQDVRDDYGQTIANIQSFFKFTVNGMEVSMSGSEFSTLYAAAMVAFMQNGNILQYFSGNKNYMTDLNITGNLMLPNHKFETLPNGHTVLRNIGG
ncbi:MAG: hypothetical protein WBL80_09420 [Erysipelotrichaceae bacterium]